MGLNPFNLLCPMILLGNSWVFLNIKLLSSFSKKSLKDPAIFYLKKHFLSV